MKRPETRISDIRYNAADRAFEALVTLTRHGETFTYPISLRAPLDMDYPRVSEAMTRLALRRHERGTTALRSNRKRPDLPHLSEIPAAVHSATNTLWERILRRAA
ncbi:hypothetical protein [Pseudooceanicola aestuarii]|uniref:hypothetical protein n=1 Tax=Pseudooceanicola aestuarii TaxID=2697319 RepID=UPI0013D48B12|nr:hypothetical protein [Pseudooceanicola aestuarii]